MTSRNLIQQLFANHAEALQVFFRRRIRERRDALDLTQEVYLRLLRAGEGRAIGNPEAYLFTVANNLLKEKSVMQRREAQRVELTHPAVMDSLASDSLSADTAVAQHIDLAMQSRGLRVALKELPPRSQLVLKLAFEDELSHQQIAQRIGVSKTMVHKILAQAIAQCRKHMARLEAL